MNLDPTQARKWVRQARQGDTKALAVLLSPDTSLLPQAFKDKNRIRYQTALERLEPEQREAILLRHHLQLSLEQVQKEMKIQDLESTRVLCDRAMVRLTSLLSVREDPLAAWETD